MKLTPGLAMISANGASSANVLSEKKSGRRGRMPIDPILQDWSYIALDDQHEVAAAVDPLEV